METYNSDEQRDARKNIWLLQTTYIRERMELNLSMEEIVQAYDKNYHDTEIDAMKNIDIDVM